VQETNRIAGEYKWWVLGAAILVNFTSAISSTITLSAAPVIVSDLNGLELYGWVVTGYLVAQTVATPVFGALSDAYGRRQLGLAGIGLFILGSVLAGVATSMPALIAARIVSGIGGGAMVVIATATISDIFPPRERGRWLGLVMGSFALASMGGPVLGGAITEAVGWRWVFFGVIPLGVLGWLYMGAVMPRLRVRSRWQMDWAGCALLVGGLTPLLLAFTWGGTKYAWTSWQELTTLGTGVALLGAFAAVELRVPNPMLDPKLFRSRVFVLAVVISFMLLAELFIALTFIPLFVQGVVGQGVQSSGVLLAPLMLAFLVGGIVGGQIVSHTGRYKAQVIFGGCAILTGFVLLTRIGIDVSNLELAGDMIMIGIGLGITIPIFSMVVQSAFPHRILGTVNSARQLFAFLGPAMMLPLMSTLLVASFTNQLAQHAPPEARPLLARQLLDPKALLPDPSADGGRTALSAADHRLPAALVDTGRRALASGVHLVFFVAAGMATLAFLLILVFPRVPLRSTWEEEE
jgi:EmrB/QacA subfamily drug resistance transporter